mgnify:CR=1 FL=1
MTEETVQQKPSITIDGVQISVDDLPKDGDGRPTFGKLQRLIQKRAVLSLDLEEIQMAINGFTAKIIAIVSKDKEPTPVNGEDESTVESTDSE